MTREKAIQELISVIPIGRTQNDRYIEALIEVIKKPKPTEQEVLKKFEELGYSVFKNHLKISLFHKTEDVEIAIWLEKGNESYCKAEKNGAEYEWITFQEHQLLTELFRCYGWIDD